MDSFIQGRDTEHSPKAEIPIRKAKKTGDSRNLMRLAYPARYDNIGHWPNYISKDSCVECKGETNIQCIKCEISLCINFNGDRNCFMN